MDAITYFFVNLGGLLFIVALIAFLLGLLLGWLIWANSQQKQSGYDWGNSTKDQDLKKCEKDRDELKRKLEDTQDELDAIKKNTSKASAQITPLVSSKTAKKATKKTAKKATKKTAKKATKKAAKKAAKQAKSHYASALSSGAVKEDKKLGIIYTKKPTDTDDLTQISGVATVLSQKLNDYGVYTYKQIALWKKPQIDEFSELLSFKDRVQRDNWVGQAKKLHKEKFGETI